MTNKNNVYVSLTITTNKNNVSVSFIILVYYDL